MEEFDELLPTPDAEGSLELSHRAWLEVDEIVWTLGLEVIKLSLAYNRLKHIAPELGDLVWRNLDTAGWGSSRRHRRWLNLVFGALMTMTWACVGLMYVQRAYCYHGSCKCCTNTHKWNSCAREYAYDDVVNYSVDTNLGRSWNTVRKCWCAQLTRAEARALSLIHISEPTRPY